MEQRLSLVTFGVRDLAAARAFYRRLGWKESPPSNQDVAFFQVGGLIFGLWDRASLVEDAGVDKPGKGFANISLAHNVRTRAEVDRILKKAAKAGATITKPAEEKFFGGYGGYFADLDGFSWEITWNPGFRILKDGSMRLPRK